MRTAMIPVERFTTDEQRLMLSRVEDVKARLLANRRTFPDYPKAPLLIAGAEYGGIWLEHNQDNIFLAEYDPDSAFGSVEYFMEQQREDGLLMFASPLKLNDYHPKRQLYWHLQIVYGFALCAMQIADRAKRPLSDYERIYNAGCRYDDWIMTHRNTAGLGLVEMFCEWDTGHDNDPRVTDDGIPHTCPDNDAARMPDLPVMPVQSVDLSAMLYGHRLGLAMIAERLGRTRDAARWTQKCAKLKTAMKRYLYDPEDEFYYDRSPSGLRKYRTEHVTRLFLNRVLDQDEFDRIYDRYFTHPGKEFLPAYPIPAVSVDDPHFDRACPHNSWGSNSQANTMERALLWMDHYQRSADLDGMLSRWMKIFLKPGSDFPQELNPFTGATDPNSRDYTPSFIIYLEAVKRLSKYF